MQACRILSIVCFASLSPAQQPAAPVVDLACFQAAVGSWIGKLDYVDYGSGERVAIPARVGIEVGPDAQWVIRKLEFADPDRIVRALDVLTVDPERGLLVSTFLQGATTERTEYRLVASERADADRWATTLQARGEDGGKPADLRIETSLAAGELRSRQTVRAIGAADDVPWTLRNELVLRRPATEPKALLGTWTVDLRPTPDAPAYLKELVIEAVDGRTITGAFYDTAFRDGRIDANWGEVRLAFVTEDGSGVYHTSALLEGERLVGTTHSLGRGFLSRWTATRRR